MVFFLCFSFVLSHSVSQTVWLLVKLSIIHSMNILIVALSKTCAHSVQEMPFLLRSSLLEIFTSRVLPGISKKIRFTPACTAVNRLDLHLVVLQ